MDERHEEEGRGTEEVVRLKGGSRLSAGADEGVEAAVWAGAGPHGWAGRRDVGYAQAVAGPQAG